MKSLKFINHKMSVYSTEESIIAAGQEILDLSPIRVDIEPILRHILH